MQKENSELTIASNRGSIASDPGSVTSLPEQVAAEPRSVAAASPAANSLLLPENDKNNEEIEYYRSLIKGYNDERFVAKTPKEINYREAPLEEQFERMRLKNTKFGPFRNYKSVVNANYKYPDLKNKSRTNNPKALALAQNKGLNLLSRVPKHSKYNTPINDLSNTNNNNNNPSAPPPSRYTSNYRGIASNTRKVQFATPTLVKSPPLPTGPKPFSKDPLQYPPRQSRRSSRKTRRRSSRKTRRS